MQLPDRVQHKELSVQHTRLLALSDLVAFDGD